jgi:hypothetical protein
MIIRLYPTQHGYHFIACSWQHDDDDDDDIIHHEKEVDEEVSPL